MRDNQQYRVLASAHARPLATLLDDFRGYGREVAVVRHHGNRRWVTTYGEIARLAGRFASLLVERDITPGDRVLIWAENSAEWIAAFYGCMLRGVIAVPLDAGGTEDFAGRVARMWLLKWLLAMRCCSASCPPTSSA